MIYKVCKGTQQVSLSTQNKARIVIHLFQACINQDQFTQRTSMFITDLKFRAINALALLLSMLYRNCDYYVIKHIESNMTALPVKQTL